MNRTRTFLKTLVVALLFGASLAFGSHAFAQTVDPTTGLESFGQAAGFVTTGSLTLTIARLIRTAISFLGILAVVFVLYGGFLYMTAGGSDDKVKRAKKVFTSAIIGLVIVLSSFVIVQFVLSSLAASEEGDTTVPPNYTCDGAVCDGGGGGSSTFILSSVNTECAEEIKNLQLQFTFSQRVTSESVDLGGIIVKAADGTAVSGTYVVSQSAHGSSQATGRYVTFTPTQTCEADGYPSEHCFDAGASYSITVDESILKSSTGRDLSCSTTYPCTFDFTVGTAIDTEGPTMTMNSPEEGAQITLNEIQDLWTDAVDDVGVSIVNFTVDGDALNPLAASTDSTAGGLSPVNLFHIADGTEWDTAGYSTGSYDLRAEGSDCAGHSDTSEAVSVDLVAAHCGNDEQDGDETGYNCGGSDCGACDGESCETDADCSSGYCDESTGLCVGVPQIERVSPGDGAADNLITVSGSNFGATLAGTVTFLGDPDVTSDDVEVSAYECNGVTQWGDEEIVVQVPSTIANGPIKVTTSDAYSDQTDDDYGPSISDFELNSIVRPGLCLLTPSRGEANSETDVSGLNLGSSQGTSTVYFSNYEASDYVSWADTTLSVVLPLLNARAYDVQVWTGDYECLDATGVGTGDFCTDDADCAALAADTECADDTECATTVPTTCHTMQCELSLADCDADSDCGSGEDCVSVRQGSNELSFTVIDPDGGTTPVVSSTDSGWEACSDGVHCGEDADCSSGTCDSADNWGPPGQYVTIYGSGFGSNTGTVHFTDDLGYANGVIDDFPDACGEDFWDDTQITVKVPSLYTNLDADGDEIGDAIHYATFSLTVETAQGAESDGIDFVIRDDEPGPGICDVDPVSGPAGTTTVTLAGDNFGSAGSVEFYDGQEVDGASLAYWNDNAIQTNAPAGTETGPVFVTNDLGFDSNSRNFEVSDCAGDDENCSAVGTQCCADGSCSASCEESIPTSHYAWMFSTGDIPAAPRVLTYCGDRDDDGSYDGVSPGPSNGWSQPADICVNTAVTATFDRAMETSTFDANISVTTLVGGTATAVAGATVASASPYTFQWLPTDNGGSFLPNTTYTVTLDSAGIKSAAGAYMTRDYSWEFTTANSTDPCEIGSVYASPSTYTATLANEEIDYLAQPIAAEDECVPLACTDYAWDWASSDETNATVSPESSSTSCTTAATALVETLGTPVDIEATATNPDGADPSDSGELTINFTDPEVTAWVPSCDTACINGAIDVTFNTDMTDDFSEGLNVSVYECEDSLCDSAEVSEWDPTDYTVSPFNHTTHSFSVTHEDFRASTWYRVVIDGRVTSTSGVALSESGSNYPSESNRYYENDFSWTFKTKNSDAPCAADRVSVSPSRVNDTYIGQQNLWEAIPYGAPDDCSASGQQLDASDYDWSAWTATDNPDVHVGTEEVAAMVAGGLLQLTSDLENGCSSDCLHTGSSAGIDDAVCGNGSIEYGEECDGGSDCTDECLNEGVAACGSFCDTTSLACDADSDCSETCDTSTGFCTVNTTTACVSAADCPYHGGLCVEESGCCGDGVWAADEECDDGNTGSDDGCSSQCLNNGARKTGTTCGDGTTDHSGATGGEDCDDGNTANGDGCSSDCLYEGGVDVEGIFSTCGNGTVEEGEDCDDADADNGDGCSSDCLYEGASQCSFSCIGGIDAGDSCSGLGAATCDLVTTGDGAGTCAQGATPCCGDGVTTYSDALYPSASTNRSEDCDDGNAVNGDGCSSSCLNEGSDENYSSASYCGDGTVDHTGGSTGGEECDAAGGYSYDINNWGVSYIQDAAAQEVINGQAGADIAAAIVDPALDDTAELTLTCSCESDASCGDESAFGCGTGSCCFMRPEEDSRYPADIAGDVCLNTAIYVDFTEEMDADTFAKSNGLPTLYVELTELDSGATPVVQTNCPYEGGWIQVASKADVSSSWIARAWDWIAASVRQLFGGQGANAATYACVVPITYSVSSNDVGGSRVSLNLVDVLEENATYAFTVVKDDTESDTSSDGVLSVNGVGVAFTDSTNGVTTTFETGTEICALDVVDVEDLGTVASLTDELADPSVGYFTESGETHQLSATAYTVNGGTLAPISETASYGWSWVWDTSVDDTVTEDNIVSVTSSDATQVVATSAGLTGRESAEAQANFLATNTFGDTTGGVNGSVALVANVCDDPPTLGFPYTDSTSNFSFFYCKDAGVAGDDTDDLPEIGILEGGVRAPIDVTSYTSDIVQELIFPVDGTSDAIGVRVLKNNSYLPPEFWYEEQGFTGSPSATTVDGYEAVKDGNTVYVAAANYSSSASRLYPNMYVISYNEDADDESQAIFDQILENWTFNANTTYVTDVNLCRSSDGSYPSVGNGDDGFVSCDWDGDCAAVGTDATCDAEKAKLTRDMGRLSDMVRMFTTVGDWSESNGLCSVTTNQECTEDSECPGSETCEPSTPPLASGTFVAPYSVSAWPSWSAALGNALGKALPEDPINQFYMCDETGYESETCWNATSATFSCPTGSHVYGYKSVGGSAYELYQQLEFGDVRWAYAIEPTGNFDTLVISIPYRGSSALANGFVKETADPFCNDTTTFGSTAICGDGIVGSGETCEIGSTRSIDCDDDSDADSIQDNGTMTVRCKTDCSGYQNQGQAEADGAECVSYECGNGVTEADNGEDCDDGSLNGSYGHCGADCTTDTAYSCGDGYLAGGEQCDCGETSNFSDVMADTESWAYLNSCNKSNGQWRRNPSGTCSWDCQYPGPSCGDAEINGTEVCDGDYAEWSGALCYGGDDDGETCTNDSECDSGACGSDGVSPDTYDACGTSAVCVGGTDGGEACTSDSTCSSGTCSPFTYDLERTRTCQSACDWDTSTPGGWTACRGGSQVCGNGTTEGNEECDDGNDDDTDACTASCLFNVCGDGSVRSGVESCDSGDRNGDICDAPYGSTCNYCTSSCKYKTTSGEYCGDGVDNGAEFCDGADVPYYCFNNASGVADRGETCQTEGATSSECESGYTCRWLGVCNGGTKQGQACALNPSTGSPYSTDQSADKNACGADGVCVAPTCADDCSSMCPFGFETASVQARTEEAGADTEESVDLYSYNSGYSPDNATFFIPACTVATGLTADVDTSGVIAPNVDIVFVTDFTLTMGDFVDGSKGCDGSDADTYADVDAYGERVTDCSSSADCSAGSCTAYAPAPYRRIDYVSEATVDAISSLFEGLESHGSTVRASAVSFYNGVSSDVGYSVDQGMTSSESSLETAISAYLTDALQTYTPHYKGLAAGLAQLSSSTADQKVVVLLSDGLPTHDKDGASCTSTSACIEEIATGLLPTLADDTKVFSAAITSSSSAKGYMAHLSSDDCGTSYSSLGDCDPDANNVEYAYQAEDADGVAEMYEDIVASILGVTVGLTTDFTGSTTTEIGTVSDGHGQALPFPEEFECDGADMVIPFTVSFNGNGYVNLSNINVTYCAAP